jgi:hypothetical protein
LIEPSPSSVGVLLRELPSIARSATIEFPSVELILIWGKEGISSLTPTSVVDNADPPSIDKVFERSPLKIPLGGSIGNFVEELELK